VTVLGWSMAEFWHATPVLLHNQLLMHRKAHSKEKKGKVKEVRYADEIPSNAW